MKLKMIITISAIVIITLGALYYHYRTCNSKECCETRKKPNPANDSSCSHCGKNSCNISCASNPSNSVSDSMKLKSLMPSCNLSGTEMIERKEFLQTTIAKKVAKVVELETGYDLIFYEPKEYSEELLKFINFERGCCSSFSYALIFEPNNKATHLQIYGSKEIKEELGTGFRELGVIK